MKCREVRASTVYVAVGIDGTEIHYNQLSGVFKISRDVGSFRFFVGLG
jgi:hypothetical protein